MRAMPGGAVPLARVPPHGLEGAHAGVRGTWRIVSVGAPSGDGHLFREGERSLLKQAGSIRNRGYPKRIPTHLLVGEPAGARLRLGVTGRAH